MPVYVPNCKHDIFVSYAHVDNEPLVGADKGWVTTLINSLKTLLGKKLGRSDVFSLWMDHELRGNTAITSDVIQQLENAATLVLILSPAYIESQWCMLELNVFLAKMGQASGRVFVVEHDVVEQRPEGLSDLLGYKFWVPNENGRPRILALPRPNPEEFQYYQMLDDLSRQLADKLKELKKQQDLVVTPSTPAVSLTPTANLSSQNINIFLAEATEDLEEQRQEVKRYLEQQGLQILPNKVYSFASIQQSLDEDLSKCRLFVQLLSEKTGHGYPQFQYDRALAADLPILQWRDPRLVVKAAEPSHRLLLETSTVIATGFVEFQAMIIKQLQPKEETKKIEVDSFTDSLVFINAAPEDMPLAHEIKDVLDAHGIGYSLPLENLTGVKSSEIRKYLEQNLLYCDAVLVIYNNTSVFWINEQLLYCRRMQGRREQPFKLIALYNVPVENKAALSIKLPNMQILDCSQAHIEACLPQFLQILQANE